MSEELIKRLRKWAKSDLGLIVMYEAADTIEAQAAEIAEYRRQHCSAAEIARPLLDALETQAAEIKRLIPMVKDALEKGRHRLLKEGFSPQDPTVRAMNEAIRALGETE